MHYYNHAEQYFVTVIINMDDSLHEYVLHRILSLFFLSTSKIYLACSLRPRHHEDAYIVIRYMFPAPPIITCNIPCSIIPRHIMWRVKMGHICRIVGVPIMVVSLLFNFNLFYIYIFDPKITNIKEIFIIDFELRYVYFLNNFARIVFLGNTMSTENCIRLKFNTHRLSWNSCSYYQWHTWCLSVKFKCNTH